MGTAHIESASPQWHQLVSAADRDALTAALADQALIELGAVLSGCEHEHVRRQIVTEVLQAAPEFGDRAVIVALARVAYTNEPDGTADREAPL